MVARLGVPPQRLDELAAADRILGEEPQRPVHSQHLGAVETFVAIAQVGLVRRDRLCADSAVHRVLLAFSPKPPKITAGPVERDVGARIAGITIHSRRSR